MGNLTLNTTNGAINLVPVDGSGTATVSIPRVGFGKYVLNNIIEETFTGSVSSSTTFTDVVTFSNLSMKANSRFYLYVYAPVRNDSTSWGGGYLQISLSHDNGTTWYSAGHSGYTLVMTNGVPNIGFYTNSLYINPNKTSDYTLKIKLSIASYDGSITINGSNEVNSTSRSNTNTNWYSDSAQFYTHYILKEYIPTT